MSNPFFSADLHSEFDRLHRRKAGVLASMRAMRSEIAHRPDIDSTDDSVGNFACAPRRAIGLAVIAWREFA